MTMPWRPRAPRRRAPRRRRGSRGSASRLARIARSRSGSRARRAHGVRDLAPARDHDTDAAARDELGVEALLRDRVDVARDDDGHALVEGLGERARPGLRDQEVARGQQLGDPVREAEANEPPGASRVERRETLEQAGIVAAHRDHAQGGVSRSNASASGAISGEPLPPKSRQTVNSQRADPELGPHALADLGPARRGRSAGAGSCPRPATRARFGIPIATRLLGGLRRCPPPRGRGPARSRSVAGNRRSR